MSCHVLNPCDLFSPQVNIAWTQMPTSWIYTVPTPMANGSLDRAPPKKQPGSRAVHMERPVLSKSPFQEIPLLRPIAQSRPGLRHIWRALEVPHGYLHLYRGLSIISRHKGSKNCGNSLEQAEVSRKYCSGGIPTVWSGKPRVFSETLKMPRTALG